MAFAPESFRRRNYVKIRIDLSKNTPPIFLPVEGDFIQGRLLNSNIGIDDVQIWLNELGGEPLTLRDLPAYTPFSQIVVKYPSTATGVLEFLVGHEFFRTSTQRTLVELEEDYVGLAKEATLSSIKSQTDKLSFDSNNFLKATIANSEIAVPVDVQYNSLDVPYSALWNADETAVQSIVLDTQSFKLLEVYAKATTATNIHLDVSPDNTNWITDYKVYSNVTEVKDTLWNGFRYVKLRSDAAGSSGDTITLVLSAKP